MARGLFAELTFDTMESEAMFTLSMLRADPNTADLAPLAEPWPGLIDAVRAFDRDFRQIEADTDAARITANQYLDSACVKFGDELYLAAGKDRSSSRWTKYFPGSVSDFVKQPLSKQVSMVRGWLSASTDEVLEKHRPALEEWSGKADKALVDTDAVAVRRRDVWQQREGLAASLTEQRDSLHRTLGERAKEKSLSRTWPDTFFRAGTASGSKSTASTEPA